MGDPTEANWVAKEFSRDDELVIGSLKGNVGHLEITAFLASLCKVCSIFETGMIPPNVNLKTPNPAIKWKEYKLRVPLEPEPLAVRASSGRGLVAMTSSGIGGSNGHCVVEGPPAVSPKPSSFWINAFDVPLLYVAAGLSPRSASASATDIVDRVGAWAGDVQQAAARAYARRARSMTWRSFAIQSKGAVVKFSEPVLSPRLTPPVVFVFSGQGTQHYAMGRELLQTSAVYRKSVLELDTIYKSVTGQSLIELTGIFDGARASDPLGEIWPIAITLVSLTMLQIALFDTLAALGIKPDVVVGHSAGETPVLYASGAGSRALAMELAIARGKAMSLLETEKGTMAAVSCSPERAAETVEGVISELGPGTLEVGCYNAPGAVTLSGHEDYVERAVKAASDAGIFARRLRTRIPVHSAMMEHCEEEYKRLVEDVFSRYRVSPTTVETWSTKTGSLQESLYDAQYYWDSTRGPVRFTEAVQGIAQKHPHAIYVELGPHPVLTSYVSAITEQKTAAVVCPLRRPRSSERQPVEAAALLEAVGKLVVAGYTCVDFDALFGTAPAPVDVLPAYPFARKDVPYTVPTAEIARQRQQRNGPLNYSQLQINEKTHPDLAEHVIKGEPIMSTAGYLEMALEFGAKKLYNVELVSIMALSAKRPTPVEVRREGSRWSVLSSAAVDYTKTWPPQYNRLHCKGHLCMYQEAEDVRTGRDLTEISSRLKPLDIKGFYDGFRTFADYGPTYQRILSCSYARDAATGRDEWLIKLRGADVDLPDIADYRIHPAILDASVHILVHPVVTGVNDAARYYLPSRIGAVIIHDALVEGPFPPIVYTHATFKAWTPETLVYDLLITTEDGTPLYSVDELEISMHGQRVSGVEGRYELVYQKTGVILNEEPLDPSTPRSTPSVELNDSGYDTTQENSDTAGSPVDRTPQHPTLATSKVVLQFRRGAEIGLQEVIKGFDTLSAVSVWLYASSGPDGDALTGFSRALRKEFPFWSIHAVIFDKSWSEEDVKTLLESLCNRSDVEPEVLVEADGSTRVPRIVEATRPPSHTTFQSSLPWKYDGSSVQQVSTPYVPPEHVLVHVTAATMGSEQLWSYVGRTSDKSPLVAGVACGPLSNIVVAHKFALHELPDGASSGSLLSALPAAIAALAVGVSSFSRPEYLKRKVILVTHSDTVLGAQVAKVYSELGAEVISIPACYTVSTLKEAYAWRPQLIVSGTKDASEAKTFQDMVSRSGRVFLWNHPDSGIAHFLETDPCSVGDALRVALPYLSASSTPSLLRPLPDLIASAIPESVPLATALFDPTKSYLLLGGIGSLGLQLAHWMYANGARELLLTSRSGRDGLLRRGDYTALRFLDYLEGLPDLSVRVARTGEAPLEILKRSVDGLQRPVGGCFILSGVLVDLPFVSQTAETFEAPFPAKVDAFALAEQVLQVDTLDFLMTFSSVSGLFGNAGQTNYASANTSLAGLTKKYRNAVCVVAPAILDTSTIKGELVGSSPSLRLKHLSNWGMTSAEFFTYVEDAIRCVRSRPVWQYVPAFNWTLVHENMGPSPLYDDLVPAHSSDTTNHSVAKAESSPRDVVCKILDVAVEDLFPDVPFTSYGLDSLSAAALSYALRPFLVISQLQLLADVSLRDIEARMEA
ncbi:hypothetical protein TRAPUB_13598 [Trametes pubescens]|uniref:Lovastatin diketide synthase LovF n=1 Tax=Trametes pubescens TaxID=154538 RepID=A0A1M2VQU2_TRAPU|nr:hypothetical protein TRAPUB_13598 [Trametes pubescens]